MKPKAFHFPKEVSDEMVRAILDGRKSVTRRVVKPQPISTSHVVFVRNDEAWFWWSGGTKKNQVKQPYRPGDILYVRETWQRKRGGGYLYKANTVNSFDLFTTPDGRVVSTIPWHPSIHMPKEAARIFLRVTDVRAERLQDITIGGTSEEGTPRPTDEDWLSREDWESPAPFCWFARMWDSTIKKADLPRYSWAANPWVWVIEFERISKEAILVEVERRQNEHCNGSVV